MSKDENPSPVTHVEGYDRWLSSVRNVGTQMANTLYNIRQRGNMAEADAATIDQMIKAWDAIPMSPPQQHVAGEPVAWRVRVKSDDPEEWSLLPAGGGADYLDREGYECQPLYVLASEGGDNG